jgi:hypothetical protein
MRVKRFVGEYGLELIIILLGAIATAAEALVSDRKDIALILGLVSVLLTVAVLSIRREIADQLGDLNADKVLIQSIPYPEWREHARVELESARETIAGWSFGVRRVSEQSALNFQIERLATARSAVCAIHMALRLDSLTMWTDDQRKFRRMVEAYGRLPPGIERQRLLVLDGDDGDVWSVRDGRSVIVDPTVRSLCELQLADQASGGLGFDLRILRVPAGTRRISDLLIVDDREAFSIDARGNDQFGNLEVTINPSKVALLVRDFRDHWSNAVPAGQFL